MNVFIADDSLMVCERLKSILNVLDGVTVVGMAHTVPDAIASIERLKPDAVILDIHMPGGSGMDVLLNVKKSPLAPIVILLTNYSFPQYRKKYMDAGADFFFDKSTEFNKVIDVFNQLQVVSSSA